MSNEGWCMMGVMLGIALGILLSAYIIFDIKPALRLIPDNCHKVDSRDPGFNGLLVCKGSKP